MVVRTSTQHLKAVVSVFLLTEQRHADASNFDDGLSKEEAYEQVLLQAEGLFDGQRNWVNWSGFYLIDTARKERDELILGPFHGKVACQTIALGRGVCGTSAAEKKTVLVKDVEAFPGHIACDSESRSEIVVPIVVGSNESRKLVGIIDIDCAVLNGFDEVDQAYLEKLAALLANSCDWP
ncbi:GAF domain-containing protein [Sporothrix brasiliensis 5110]|uniref:GAF domain-containing protein n=1 Tax=Sporothrix brasiliensis 5110 TaxID=1398154 RepID=A0A0C2ILX5_9PEZI|nr:GAF domain-containing protein [Sporothrix brasiliensis 5110]KIH88000.1 GAF domain-containing protein [Sporothrix brasiliensis 5110]